MKVVVVFVLALFSFGQPFFTPPSGVQFSTSESYLTSNGMVKCLDVPYSFPITESALTACGDASWVFVGAKHSSSENKLFIGAFGLASEVFRYTASREIAYPHNGVFWYKVQFYAFGFSATSSILLNYADIATTRGEERLSWHYNSNNFGGWRAGNYDYLNSNINFRKVIYRLPVGAGAPTAAPSVLLPACNVQNEEYLGDGYCDSSGGYNTAACDFDRGDCCSSTCVDGEYTCGIVGYSCVDPGTEAPSRQPSPAPSTQAPTPNVPTEAPSNPPTQAPTATSAPTLEPSTSPTTPSSAPSAVPTTAPSTAQPSARPSLRPSLAPTDHFQLNNIQYFEFDSSRPYESGKDVYITFQFPNMSSYDSGDLYYTTITFSNTKLRNGDYITLYTDGTLTDVYGEPQYSGTSFPGMNGNGALGFRAFRFVLHFHSGPGEVPVDNGYMMNAEIRRYDSSSDIPGDRLPVVRSENENTYLGMSYAGMTAMFSVIVSVASLCFCCLLFWYGRAHTAAKVAAEEQIFDARLHEHREALKRNQAIAQKGKNPASKTTSKKGKRSSPAANTLVDVVAEPPLQYMCPISCELMRDPVICSDGFTYDRESIEMWLSAHGTSPMTNAPVVDNIMIPNLALKGLIQNFMELGGRSNKV